MNDLAEGSIYRRTISAAGSLVVMQSVGSGGNAFVSLDSVRFPVA